MKGILKQETALDELAEEVAELVTNSNKLSDVLKTTQENEIIQKKNLSEMATLKNRITNLENRINKLVKDFKTNLVEAERLVTEKYEQVNKENEEAISNLQEQITGLEDSLSKS